MADVSTVPESLQAWLNDRVLVPISFDLANVGFGNVRAEDLPTKSEFLHVQFGDETSFARAQDGTCLRRSSGFMQVHIYAPKNTNTKQSRAIGKRIVDEFRRQNIDGMTISEPSYSYGGLDFTGRWKSTVTVPYRYDEG